jgi:hypothetical protein
VYDFKCVKITTKYEGKVRVLFKNFHLHSLSPNQDSWHEGWLSKSRHILLNQQCTVRDANKNSHQPRDTNENSHQSRDTNENSHQSRDTNENSHQSRDTNENSHQSRDTNENSYKSFDTNENFLQFSSCLMLGWKMKNLNYW